MGRFVHQVHMRWSDMDAYRHVNNSAYLQYLEQARVAMFFDRGEGFERGEGFASGTVIARHEIDYLRPVVYHPEPLRLELWISEVRAASFTVRYEVFDRDKLVARAATQCVTFDFSLDRPRRLAAEEKQFLLSFGDEPGVESATAAPASSAATPASPATGSASALGAAASPVDGGASAVGTSVPAAATAPSVASVPDAAAGPHSAAGSSGEAAEPA